MGVKKVRAEQEACYAARWVEPSFAATAKANSSVKHTIGWQADFIYCKRTMDPKDAEADAIASSSLSCDH